MSGLDIPIFVINLDRRPERFESITNDLDRLGLEAVRVSARDARTVSDEELRARVDLDAPMRKMGRGSAATLLSHIVAMEMFLSTSSPVALILEDDAELANDLPLFLRSLDWWPTDASLVKLEAHGAKLRVFGRECAPRHESRQLRPISLSSAGTAGYMVTREAAEFVSAECRRANMPTDCILFDLRISRFARKLRPVQVLPGLVRQRVAEFESDIKALKREASASGLNRPWHRLGWQSMAMRRKAVVGAQRLLGLAQRSMLDFADTVVGASAAPAHRNRGDGG